MIQNKKAQGISINIVIIVVLALLALAVVGYFVISGFGTAGGGVTSTTEGITDEAAGDKGGIVQGISGLKSKFGADDIGSIKYVCCQNSGTGTNDWKDDKWQEGDACPTTGTYSYDPPRSSDECEKSDDGGTPDLCSSKGSDCEVKGDKCVCKQ